MDRETATRLVLCEREKLLAYVWLIVRDEHIAEDVLQELVLLVVSKCETIRSPEHLGGWLRKAARLKALEAVRARKGQPAVLENNVLDLLDGDWSDVDSAETVRRQEALGRCYDKLSEYAQQLVYMRYYEGLRSGAIARRLGKPTNVIYMALMRTHRRLGDCVRRRLALEAQGA